MKHHVTLLSSVLALMILTCWLPLVKLQAEPTPNVKIINFTPKNVIYLIKAGDKNQIGFGANAVFTADNAFATVKAVKNPGNPKEIQAAKYVLSLSQASKAGNINAAGNGASVTIGYSVLRQMFGVFPPDDKVVVYYKIATNSDITGADMFLANNNPMKMLNTPWKPYGESFLPHAMQSTVMKMQTLQMGLNVISFTINPDGKVQEYKQIGDGPKIKMTGDNFVSFAIDVVP